MDETPQITLYQHKFEGKHLTFRESVPNFPEIAQASGIPINDQISSIRIKAGRWTLYEHADYKGSAKELRPGEYPQVEEVGIRNDSVSSVRSNRVVHADDRARQHACEDIPPGTTVTIRAANGKYLRVRESGDRPNILVADGTDPTDITTQFRLHRHTNKDGGWLGLQALINDRFVQAAPLREDALVRTRNKNFKNAKLHTWEHFRIVGAHLQSRATGGCLNVHAPDGEALVRTTLEGQEQVMAGREASGALEIQSLEDTIRSTRSTPSKETPAPDPGPNPNPAPTPNTQPTPSRPLPPAGSIVSILASNGQYWRVDTDRGNRLFANASTPQERTTQFRLHRHHPEMGGWIGLECLANGHFVQAVPDADGTLRAENRNFQDPDRHTWEHFTVEGDALRSRSTGQVVTILPEPPGAVRTKAGAPDPSSAITFAPMGPEESQNDSPRNQHAPEDDPSKQDATSEEPTKDSSSQDSSSETDLIDLTKPLDPHSNSWVGGLIDRPATQQGSIDPPVDPRKLVHILAIVRDPLGNTLPGIQVRLLDQDRVRDSTHTDARGLAIMRYPTNHPSESDKVGTLEVPIGGVEATTRQVLFQIPAGQHHTVVEINLEQLPTPTGPAEDPLRRLPADFNTKLLEDVLRFLGPTRDPLLGRDGESFASTRTPIIHRAKVIRVGPPSKDGGPPRRYVVSVRQEWTFLGYSLGEVQSIDGLVPGESMQEARRSLQDTLKEVQEAAAQSSSSTDMMMQRAARSVDTLVNSLENDMHQSLDSQSHVDSHVDTSVIHASISFGIASASYTRTDVNTDIRTSLKEDLKIRTVETATTSATRVSNEQMRQSQRSINETVQRASRAKKRIQTLASSSLQKVSPLLSRATNLLEWSVYENYAVATFVEDVSEVVRYTVARAPDRGHLFNPQSIVEYYPIFLQDLIRPDLAPAFSHLRDRLEVDEIREKDLGHHPLVRHINSRRHHYLGLLLEAALDDPGLRNDAPQLRGLRDSSLWRLPIIGFDGGDALILRDVHELDSYASQLREDPGAATIVQIAAPGTYMEALQGVLKLDDLEGRVHPALLPILKTLPEGSRVIDPQHPTEPNSARSSPAKAADPSPHGADQMPTPGNGAPGTLEQTPSIVSP